MRLICIPSKRIKKFVRQYNMILVNRFFLKLYRFANLKSRRFLSILALLSFCAYFGIIIFGFIPTTQIIETSTFSTGDLQAATSRNEVDTILSAWEPVMDAVILLSILDYLFILSGIILSVSIHSLIVKALPEQSKLVYVPLIGMIATFFSRLLDSLENLWAILIYGHPGTYVSVLIPLLNYSEQIKWIFVIIEYSMLALAVLTGIFHKVKKKKK